MSSVIEVSGDFSKWVNASEKRLVVADFYATWCGPCKMMHPIFDKLSTDYPNVVFLRVDSDQNSDLKNEYGINGIPTFIFFFHGDEVDRVVGANQNELEAKIQQYGTTVPTFTGNGFSLGGTGSYSPDSAREMRLKKFGDIKIHGTDMTSKAGSLIRKMQKQADTDDEVIKDLSPALTDKSIDDSIKDSLLTMGFSSSNVDNALHECESRDLAELVAFITAQPDNNDIHDDNDDEKPNYVCNGDECFLMPPKAEKSYEDRMEDARLLIEKKKHEKQVQEKENERIREKERIEKGKEMQASKEEYERLQRQREAEKQKQEKISLEQEKQRQLELWRKDHGILPTKIETVVEKSFEERIRLLVESIALQRIDNAGINALTTVKKILVNTSRDDPKYRQLKRDNALLQKRIVCVPGALPLLQMAGFVLDGEVFIMKEKDEEKVNLIVSLINKYL